MNTEQLKTFLSLAETKNFSRSAEALIISQSTVSKRIGELEKETGQPLFLRGRGGVRLTGAGQALREYAEQIVNLEEKALSQMNRTGQYSGYLILGSAYAYYDMHLCSRLRVFAQRHPDVSVRVKCGHTGALLNELRRALLDVAFTHHPFHNPDYVCICVGEDELVLVTDAKNTEHCGGISYASVKELPLIDSNFLYGTTQRRLFPPSCQFQLRMDIASCAVPLLKGGGWYAILARKHVEALLQSGRLRVIPIRGEEIPPVQHYMVYRKESGQQPAVQKFISAL